jgi:mRNA interferase MazF
MPSPYCPDEGDIVWIDFDPQKGNEQRGRRRALVVTPHAYNRRTNLSVLCPITSKVKGYPFEIAVPPGGTTTGVVLGDQVKSVSWSDRNADFIEKSQSPLLVQVRAMIKALLKIP